MCSFGPAREGKYEITFIRSKISGGPRCPGCGTFSSADDGMRGRSFHVPRRRVAAERTAYDHFDCSEFGFALRRDDCCHQRSELYLRNAANITFGQLRWSGGNGHQNPQLAAATRQGPATLQRESHRASYDRRWHVDIGPERFYLHILLAHHQQRIARLREHGRRDRSHHSGFQL